MTMGNEPDGGVTVRGHWTPDGPIVTVKASDGGEPLVATTTGPTPEFKEGVGWLVEDGSVDCGGNDTAVFPAA